MSIMSALYTGTSGLQANSQEISVIGDNIANANTIGFKAGRAAFEDALSQSLIGNTGQMGLGARLQAIQRIITQGALVNTGLATDLALQGPGMFMVKGSHNGIDTTFYTRAGQFTVDQDGYLVNLEGLKVQGYQADAAGNVLGNINDLQVGATSSAPNPTANVTLRGNLQADAVVPAAWDINNPATTSNFSSSVTVYDSLGNEHQVDVYFRKTAAGAWEWHAITDGAGVQGGTAGTPSEIANGTLTYDTQGRMTASTQAGTFNPVGAVQPQAITFNFGDPTGGGGTGVGGMTQYATTSATSFMNQDGYTSGTLAAIQVDASGNVVGAFTNGQTRTLGQVAVADFEAADQLTRVGGNLYMQAPDSGQPSVGAASTGGRGGIVAGALEQSNVDLAQEFVRMIAAQRGFQANSKTISTADQMLADLMQLKR